MISVHFEGKLFNISVIQVYARTHKSEEHEVEQLYEDLQDLLELIPPNNVLFIIGDWNTKVGSQEIPGVTVNLALDYRMKKVKANRDLRREHTGHSKHPLSTTQEKTLHMEITRWSIPKQIHYILCTRRWRSKLYIVSKNKTGR